MVPDRERKIRGGLEEHEKKVQRQRRPGSGSADRRGGVIWVIVQLIWWILAALVLIVTDLVVRAILAEQRRRTTAYAAYQAAMVDRADRQNAPGEPPCSWSTGQLTAMIAGVIAASTTGAALLIHQPTPFQDTPNPPASAQPSTRAIPQSPPTVSTPTAPISYPSDFTNQDRAFVDQALARVRRLRSDS